MPLSSGTRVGPYEVTALHRVGPPALSLKSSRRSSSRKQGADLRLVRPDSRQTPLDSAESARMKSRATSSRAPALSLKSSRRSSSRAGRRSPLVRPIAARLPSIPLSSLGNSRSSRRHVHVTHRATCRCSLCTTETSGPLIHRWSSAHGRYKHRRTDTLLPAIATVVVPAGLVLSPHIAVAVLQSADLGTFFRQHEA